MSATSDTPPLAFVRRPEPPYYGLQGPYTGGEPRFYSREECPWLGSVEVAWEEIRDEAIAFLRRHGRTLGMNFDPYGFDVSGWRTLNFQTYLRRYHRHCTAFPSTMRLLDAIPGLTSAFLNVLDPHTRIPAHHGDSNTVRRCHLGLVVPGEVDRCGIQVGDERRGWREGKAFAFCDAHEHFAWNDTDRPRVVLVFDVMTEPYRRHRFWICGNVLAAIVLVLVDTRSGLLSKLPKTLVQLLRRGLGLGIAAWLPLQRLRFGGRR